MKKKKVRTSTTIDKQHNSIPIELDADDVVISDVTDNAEFSQPSEQTSQTSPSDDNDQFENKSDFNKSFSDEKAESTTAVQNKTDVISNISVEVDKLLGLDNDATQDNNKKAVEEGIVDQTFDQTRFTGSNLFTKYPFPLNITGTNMFSDLRLWLVIRLADSIEDFEYTFPLIIKHEQLKYVGKDALATWGSLDHINYRENKNFLVRGGGVVARSLKARKYIVIIVGLFVLELLIIGAYKIYERTTLINLDKRINTAINIGWDYVSGVGKYQGKGFIHNNNVLVMNEYKRENAVYKFDKTSFTNQVIKVNFNNFNEFAIVYTTNALIHLGGSHSVSDFYSACSIVVDVFVKGNKQPKCYDPNNHSDLSPGHLQDWGDGWIDTANYYLNKKQFSDYSKMLGHYFGYLHLTTAKEETIYPFNVGGGGLFWKDIALNPRNLDNINFKSKGKSTKVYFKSLEEFTMDSLYPDTADSSRYDNVKAFFYDPTNLRIHQPTDIYGYRVLADKTGVYHISLDQQTQLLNIGIIKYNHNQYVEKRWSIDWSKVTNDDFTPGNVLSVNLSAAFPSYIYLRS